MIVASNAAGQSLFSLDATSDTPRREVRAIWLTTLKGLDWPKRPAVTPEETEQQKKELIVILDQLQAAGINTVLFQSRIRSTTAYPSDIEPWDGIFTGTPGKAPLYDPLQLALDECHKRGMELHAWVVAYPICDVKVAKVLGKEALPNRHRNLCQRCGDKWMMDPGVPGTDDYIASMCAEIVQKYPVDGIHLDYIRYPENGVPFNDYRTYRKYGKGKQRNAWRKENIDRAVRKIHDAVKTIRPWVKLSCSPIGKYADLPQQSSYGWNARDAVHQDAQAWLRDGLMDMIFPMLYFDGKHFYPFIQDWQAHSYGRQVVPGLGTYLLHPKQKDWKLEDFRRQMLFAREIGTSGHAQFRSLFFTDNVKGIYDFVAHDLYRKRVQTPPMTWEDSIAPSIPEATITTDHQSITLHWKPAVDNQPGVPVSYNIYYSPTDTFNIQTAIPLAFGVKVCQYQYFPGLPSIRRGYYAVTAVDAYGNESAGKAISAYVENPPRTFVCPADSKVAVPAIDGAEYLLVCDITGKSVFTTSYQDTINVSSLAPGFYSLRTLGKKGKSHYLFTFWKERGK